MNWLIKKVILKYLKNFLKRIEGGDITMDTKSIFKSKTLWANVLAGILIIAQEIGGVTPANLDAGTQGVILSVVNIILRLITKQPVKIK